MLLPSVPGSTEAAEDFVGTVPGWCSKLCMELEVLPSSDSVVRAASNITHIISFMLLTVKNLSAEEKKPGKKSHHCIIRE